MARERGLESGRLRRRRQQIRSGGGKESIGHESDRHIVAIKRKKADLADADFAHMKKVVSYVHRHAAQKPSGNIAHSRWRFSLINAATLR